ncbi:BA14K family protein [Chthonobacter rhizosphaerae]|uniref:BA14K family protein n=1 Tax=Chthonobacter rhizosphaerae TaxID=2735553 RepID=UPI0015EF160A|nr:BA14K family protein [Chthonobacter rhizosphaerae]
MKTFGVLMSVAAITAATTLSPTPVEARDRTRDVVAGAALGVLGGVLIGQALAPQPLYAAPPPPPPVYYEPQPVYVAPPPVYRQPQVIYEEPRPSRHYRRVSARAAHRDWCEDRYRSYDAYDNTWVDRYGRVRECVSPYGN